MLLDEDLPQQGEGPGIVLHEVDRHHQEPGGRAGSGVEPGRSASGLRQKRHRLRVVAAQDGEEPESSQPPGRAGGEVTVSPERELGVRVLLPDEQDVAEVEVGDRAVRTESDGSAQVLLRFVEARLSGRAAADGRPEIAVA